MGSAGPRYSRQPLYYDGKRQTTKDSFQTIDPSCDQPLADICKADKAAVDAAIQSAQAAFPKWAATPPMERSRILLRAVALLRKRNDDLALVETHDTGKPFSETSTVDVITGADVLEYYANLVASGGLNGETTPLRTDAWVYTTKAPLGVCAGIGAWNYPIQIALWKSAPCLAAGNCMVYKPSEFTPLHALHLAEIYSEAGLPPGVFNVVQGAGDVGGMLTSHPAIAKVSFTGQVSTGCKVAGSAAGGMKYVTMELGGKSPCIILPDADLENAVDGAMMANFFSTGQVCTNGTRVFVPQSMHSAFENPPPRENERHPARRPHGSRHQLRPPRQQTPPGKSNHLHPPRHRTQTKPPSSPAGSESPNSFYRQLNGYWVKPTIFTNCTDSMKITHEEIFGPVMCILPYPDSPVMPPSDPEPHWLAELIDRANATPMGLAAGVFTKNIDLGHKMVQKLEAGITWVNTWGESPAEMPVGGWKMSGLGVENGRKGIENWVQNKSTLVEMGGRVATSFSKL